MGRVIFAWVLLVALVACDDRVERPAEDVPYPPAELVRFQNVVDTLLQACYRKDSVACDTLIGILEDPRLAHTAPSLVADGYWSYVAAHANEDPHLARMSAFAREVNSPSIENWCLVVRGEQAYGLMRFDTAMALYSRALPGFETMADTAGMLECNLSLATLHLYRLYQPRQALHYLRAREAFPRSVDVRFVDAALMATAYRDLSLTDSARVQLAVMDSLWPDVERIAPGNPENKVYHDDVLFMILCTEAAKTKQVNMDTLHRLFQDEVAFVEGGYKKYGWNPITVRIDYANALLANGQDREAEAVLKGGEHILANCIKCKYHAIEFYQLLVGILKARKDFAGAFHYQELNVKAKRELDIEARRTSVDQVLASLRFEQQRDSLTLVNQREQAAADAAVSRGKSQRDLLLIGGALALVIAALLWNRARLKRRLQVEQLRTRLSRDLHDDIGSTLSSINILSSVAQKRVEASGDSDAAIALSKISDRSQRLMRDMSDIVWSVDPKKDSLEDLVIRMREFGTTVMDPKGIDFTFSTSQNLPSALPVEVKNNLYLIFKEAMNNAAKHARATAVESRLSWEKQILRLEVSDNGTGLGPASDESGHGGNGLRNMRERAAEIKGELHVRSEPGKGLRITLLLPLR